MTPGQDNPTSLLEKMRRELRRVLIFGLIGVLSLSLMMILYSLSTRVLFPTTNKTALYVACSVIVTYVNYLLNRRVTFAAAQHHPGAIGRFAGVAVVATGLNAVLFWLGHDVLHIFDLLVIVGNAFIIALFTFTSHRQFTFHPRPWRHLQKQR